MSKVIDERVVEMRFDNRHFEQNVKTSMSTLDKLKNALNFKGASKGLENLNTSVNKVNMTPLGKGIEAVHAKFSALEVMGVTALANITNSAVNAGKRIASALTIDPIKTGFSEYETQINAVQTIMANTSKDGTTLDQVNAALDELNAYADKTIYNFTEMTRNIGTFTAAGVDLETSVSAIQGIANVAAISGSTSQQASTAMYQLSQALAAGRVSLMDWNSVVNAGMGGEVFQSALRETSELLGTGAEAAIKAQGSFRESLKDGWLTSEVLTETLKKFTTSGANEYVAKYTGLSQEAVEATLESAKAQYGEADAINEAAKALAKKSGKSEEEIKSILNMAKTSEDAATKVKTLSQLWDTLKEAAQSGWSQTWEIVVGDFEEAKKVFTSVSDTLGGVIGRFSDARNALLEGALNITSPWTKIMDKLDGAGLGTIKKVSDTVGDLTDKLSKYQEVVDKVWRGDFGNADTGRFDKLNEAGWDSRVVQDLVNKGQNYKLTVEDIEASHKKFGLTMKKSTEETKTATSTLANLSDEQLKNAGLTESEIKLYKDLAAEADKTGVSIEELVEKMSKKDGRTLLIESFKNAWKGLTSIFKAVHDAWVDIFPPMSVVQLYSIIEGINKFSQHLVVGKETADNLKRTFKGLFAIIDIIGTLLAGPLKIAIKTVATLLGKADLNILEYTATIGDAIVKVRDWIDAHNPLVKIIEAIIPHLQKAGEAFGDWINKLKESDNLPRDIVQGLVNGLKSGVKTVVDIVVEIGTSLLNAIKDVLGIHSPSTEFFEIGKNIIQGLFNGLTEGPKMVLEFMSNLGENMINLFKHVFDNLPIDNVVGIFENVFDTIKSVIMLGVDKIKSIDPGTLIAGGFLAGLLFLIKKINDTVQMFASPLESINDMMDSLGGMFKSIGGAADALRDKIKGNKWEHLGRTILMVAVAIAILAGSVYLLSTIKTGDLWKAVGAIAVLAVVLIGLSVALKLINGVIQIGGFKGTALLALAASLLLIAFALQKMTQIKIDDVPMFLLTLGSCLLSLTAILLIIGAVIKGDVAANIHKVGFMLIEMSVALLIMVKVMKLIGELDATTIIKGVAVITLFEGLCLAMAIASAAAGEHASKAGSMLLKMSLAMLIMVGVIKLAGMMSPKEIFNGLAAVAGIGLLFTALIAVSKLAGKNAAKAGTMLILMSGAMLIMVGVIALISRMNSGDIEKGIGAIKSIGLIFAALIAVSKLAGENAVKAGTMLLLMSGALVILTGVIWIISKLEPSGLARGLAVVAVLELLFMGIIAVSRNARGAKAGLIALTVTVGILAGALIALSFIDPKSLATASASLSAVIGMFALLVASTKFIKGVKISSLVSMIIVAGLLAGLMFAMSQIKSDVSVESVGSIVVLMVTMAGVTKLLSTMSGNLKSAAVNIGSFVVMLGALALMIYILNSMKPEIGIEKAAALSMLIVALSGSVALLAVAGKMGPMAVGVGLAGLFLMLSGFGVLLRVLGSLSEDAKDAIQNGIPILAAVGEGIGSLVGSIVSGFVSTASEGLPTLAENLSSFMDKLSGFIEGAKNLDGLDVGGLATLAGAITAFLTLNMIDSLMSIMPFVGSLAELGTDLSKFMLNLVPFIAIASTVNAETMAGAKALAETLLVLTTAELLAGISEFLGFGDSSMEDFAAQLIPFGKAMAEFSNVVSGNIDADAVEAAANAGQMLADLANTLPNSGGKLGEWLGENDIDDFGAMLVPFGECMVAFSQTVSGNIDTDAVEAAANAGQMMADLADTLPNSGGVVADWFGENDIDDFGAMLVPFGEAMVSFSQTVSGNIDADGVEAAANAGTIMAKMAETLPNSGGVVEFFTGGNDMDDFGEMLVAFGECMVDFSDTISGNIDMDAVNSAAIAGAMFSAIANSIPDSGSIFDIFTGDTSIDEFGEQLVAFGESIVDFSSAISGNIDDASITSAINATNDIIKLAELLPKCENVAKIDDTLVDFAEGMVTFSQKIVGQVDVDAINGVSTAGKTLAEMADVMPEEVDLARITSGLQEFGDAIVEFSDVVDEGLDDKALTTATKAGKGIADIAATIPTNVDLTSFSSFITKLGSSLVTFSTQIQNGLEYLSVINGVNAGKKITEFMSTIPVTDVTNFTDNAGKIASSIVTFSAKSNGTIDSDAVDKGISSGEKIADFMSEIKSNSVDVFVNNAGSVATAIVSFYNKVKAGFDFMTVSFAVSAGKMIADFMANIKSNSVTTFVDNAGKVGEAIVSFATKCINNSSYFSEGGAVYQAIEAGKSIANFMANNIKTNGSVTSFINNAGSVATAIVSFSNNAKDSIDITAVGNAVWAGKSISEFINGCKTNSVASFIDNAGAAATAIVSFSNNAKNSLDIAAVGNGVWAGKKITEFLSNIPDTDIGGFATNLPLASEAIVEFANDLVDLTVPDTGEITKAFKHLSSEGIKAFTSTFANAGAKFTEIGDNIIAKTSKGISRSKTALVLGFSKAITSVKNAGKQSGSSFNEVGSAMISGIVNGVNANSYKAIAAVTSICNAMVRVAKSILGINSPSKVFYEFGEFTVLGFTNAIDDNLNSVGRSASEMAEAARNGISSAIGKISDIINSDIDAEPTIRPVLDLSDVESGSRLINGMFNNRLAIGATADVGSISSMMNSTIQNGGNDDVISAIDKLRDSLGNIGGNTYNVNGVTYDDGSNVSNAVKSLVRAARIERRV